MSFHEGSKWQEENERRPKPEVRLITGEQPHSKPETEIPAEIKQWINNFCIQEPFDVQHSCNRIACALYAKIQADKPTGLRWIGIKPPGSEKSNLPEIDEFVLWRTESGNYFVREIDKDDYEWWNVDMDDPFCEGRKCTYWARIIGPDESTPDETTTLRAQLTAAQAEIDRVAGEAVKLVKDLIPMAKDGYKLCVSNGAHQEFLSEDREILRKANDFVAKYPPTQNT